MNICSASTADIISTTERLKQELETTTQRQEIVTCFLRDYQLSPEEVSIIVLCLGLWFCEFNKVHVLCYCLLVIVDHL